MSRGTGPMTAEQASTPRAPSRPGEPHHHSQVPWCVCGMGDLRASRCTLEPVAPPRCWSHFFPVSLTKGGKSVNNSAHSRANNGDVREQRLAQNFLHKS